MRKLKPPDVCVIRSTAIRPLESDLVEWLGESFPSAFEVALELSDRAVGSDRSWAVRATIAFLGEGPTLREVAVGGLFEPSKLDLNELMRALLPESESELKAAGISVSKVEQWQLRYVSDRYQSLIHAGLEAVARALANDRLHVEEGILPDFLTGLFGKNPEKRIGLRQWSPMEARTLDGDGKVIWERLEPLEDFGKRFRQWSGRTRLTPELLQKVAEVYRAEVEAARLEGRKAAPRLAVERAMGRPKQTVDRWVKAAAEAGLLELTQPRDKPGKPGADKQKGKRGRNAG